MADAVPSDTALTEAFKKVVGDPANPAGVTPAGGAVYATPAGSRPSGDIINISQAPGLMYTPAEQWAHESDLARQAQSTLEQNRQYDLSKAKFDWDKQQQQNADLNNALALQRSMRGGGGGGSYGYGRPMTIQSTGDPYAGWNRVGDYSLPGTQYTGAQGNVMAVLKPLGGKPRQLMAPPNLSGPQLGTWADQQRKAAMREGRTPPQILQNIYD